MNRTSLRMRIIVAMVFAFIAIKISPVQWVGSPTIPTKEEVMRLVDMVTISIVKIVPVHIPTPTEEVVPAPSPAWMVNPTDVPLSPTSYIKTPSIAPTVVYIFSPTPTDIFFPSITRTSIPTMTPSVIRPSLVPTKKPIPTPLPTTAQTDNPDYSALNAFVANPPQIGCRNNTISGCPVDALYTTPLEKGLGWATYYGDEHREGYNVVADVIHNNKGVTIEAARKFINDNYMENQSALTPREAKKTGKVIAFGATRTPKDLWKIKYAFGIDNPKSPHARFIGRIMIIDCAATGDWKNNLATLSYSYKGWTALNWIVDLSKNGFVQLPAGYSGRMDNIGEGRPGVVLIDEESLDSLLY